MLQETRVRQAHKKSRPIGNTSYRTYYSSLPANRTRSGKKQDDNVGAAMYDELTSEVELTGVPGAPTVLRAELVAILIAIRRTETLRNVKIFSDSLTAIRLIR
eukprot:408908-Prorocentrum_minimum.AAC.1